MLPAKFIRKVNEAVDNVFPGVRQEQAVIPVIEEGDHLLLGICTLFRREFLILFVILYHADEPRDPQYFRCRAPGEVIGPYGGIRYLGDLYKDGYYHVLICLRKRRKGKITDTVRIRSQEFIQTEVPVKICGYGAPPVESKVIE